MWETIFGGSVQTPSKQMIQPVKTAPRQAPPVKATTPQPVIAGVQRFSSSGRITTPEEAAEKEAKHKSMLESVQVCPGL